MARICREAGGRVATSSLERDLDLPVPPNDGRRLEVVVDGLPIYGKAQQALDTTLVSALHCDGSARRGAAARDGVALAEARRCKQAGVRGWWLLLVKSGDVGPSDTWLRLAQEENQPS